MRLPAVLACCLLAAQDTTIRTRVNLVVAPATVTDAQGRFVDGLAEEDFELLDNGKPRQVRVDTSDIALTPISLVVCVQANQEAGAALAKIRKVGSLVEPLITGERGEAAFLRFAESSELVQDFTSDGAQIATAFKQLKPRGAGARSLDAAVRAIELLRARDANRRKIVLLISESRDRGSQATLAAVLQMAQRDNVTVYPVTFSVHLTPWTARPADAPPSPGGLDPLRAIVELVRLGKANTAEELARFTGGRRLSFTTLRGLESDLGRLGEELHSQYLISFSPARTEGDDTFHVLEIRVRNRPDLRVAARPGYWPM